MIRVKGFLAFISALTIIFAFSVLVSAQNDLVINDSEKYLETSESDYENDPLYIKYLNQPMAMSSVAGSNKLIHNKTFAKYDKVYGVDVSYFQNTINWKKVKSSGIDFAVIRVGYRGYGDVIIGKNLNLNMFWIFYEFFNIYTIIIKCNFCFLFY